jgi:hypothetical protein
MQNKKWILVAVAAIILIIAGYFLIQGGGLNFATMGNTSLRTLLASGQSQKCSFNNAQSSGTIYVGGGKMRGDFTSKVGEATAQSHMVIANNIVYVWIDGQPVGYRMAFNDMKPGSGNGSQGVDADAKVATDCTSWQATESSFELPADVSFADLSAAGAAQQNSNADASTNSSGGAGANTEAGMSYYEQQCAACNAIPDAEAKAQCIASFDCP